MRIIDNIPVYGASVDEGALAQIKTCARTADRVALMADHHKGYAVPIGGVVAYAEAISPSGVGYDIACGNKAVLTDASAEEVKRNIGVIMDSVWSTISFGIGRKNNDERVDHDLFDDPAWSIEACKPLKEMARQQLGTVGSGNHYVDIFEDEQGRVWIGVHFGSRGLATRQPRGSCAQPEQATEWTWSRASCRSAPTWVRSIWKGCASGDATPTRAGIGFARVWPACWEP